MSRLIDADALIEDINVWFADSYHLIDSVKERIDAAPTIEQPHWIPCSERLPDDVEIGEEYPTVIFCTSDGAVYVGGYEHYLGGKWWYMDTWEDEAKGVVAWMPLPEPYRRVNRND